MIASFGDKATKDVYDGTSSPAARKILASTGKVAARKLDVLHAAHEPKDLQVPPGNRLEKLKGDLSGFWSIRINGQFRIIFKFANGTASDVRIVDYH